MFAMWLSTVFEADRQPVGDRGVGAALGHQGQDVALAVGQGGQRVGGDSRAHQVADDLRVEDRAAGGDRAQCAHQGRRRR